MEGISFILALCILSVLLNIYFVIKNSKQSFKIGYYEQTLLSHKSKFSSERWECIERIINKK